MSGDSLSSLLFTLTHQATGILRGGSPSSRGDRKRGLCSRGLYANGPANEKAFRAGKGGGLLSAGELGLLPRDINYLKCGPALHLPNVEVCVDNGPRDNNNESGN